MARKPGTTGGKVTDEAGRPGASGIGRAAAEGAGSGAKGLGKSAAGAGRSAASGSGPKLPPNRAAQTKPAAPVKPAGTAKLAAVAKPAGTAKAAASPPASRPVAAAAQPKSSGVKASVKASGKASVTTSIKASGGVGPVAGAGRPPVGKVDRETFRLPAPVQNLFWRGGSAGGSGVSVVRPEDLAVLRIELAGMTISGGAAPQLRRAGSAAGRITLHFPPQSIAEQSFFEAEPPGYDEPADPYAHLNPPKPPQPGGSEAPTAPPVRARIAGESRIVFDVPAGFEAPWTLEGVLDAVRRLEPVVAPNAKARQLPPNRFRWESVVVSGALKALNPRLKGRAASFTLRSRQLALSEDTASLVGRRVEAVGSFMRPTKVGRVTIPTLRLAARPANPSPGQTAIELPFRLILSPHAGERFLHAAAPVAAPSGRTELWHSRLTGAKGTKPRPIEPPNPDPNRTVRAIWALTGEGSDPDHPMSGTFPTVNTLPAPLEAPFRLPMNDFDRAQIVHLSSNFSVSNYRPEPVDASLMMLSALGGWLDSRGAWDPPGLSVEEWAHRASMARDHYVRVVYKGFLFPFGHRVSLVKVTERKFHSPPGNGTTGQPQSGNAGNIAYLRQRLFIVVRERERRFDEPVHAALRNNAGTEYWQRKMPFASVRILTQQTPNLDQPAATEVKAPAPESGYGQQMFWPAVGGKVFPFQCVGIDLDGNRVAFEMPMIFLDNAKGCPRKLVNNRLEPDWAEAAKYAGQARTAYQSRLDRRRVAARKQRLALAQSARPGDTALEAQTLQFSAETEANNPTLVAVSEQLTRPLFFPSIEQVEGQIGALSKLGGSPDGSTLTWNAFYLRHGFAGNKGEVFANVGGAAKLDFSAQGDRSGGFVQPNLKPQALSRLAGPVMGDVAKFVAGQTDPGGGFPTSLSDLPLPLLFGCIPLGAIIEAVADLTNTPDQIPKFASEAATGLETLIGGLGRLFGFLTDIAAQPGQVGEAATRVFQATLDDLKAQGAAYAAAQVAPVLAKIADVRAALEQVGGKLEALQSLAADAPPSPDLAALPAAASTARARIAELRTLADAEVGGVSLPSGFRQAILSAAQGADLFLADLAQLPALVAAGKALFQALEAIVGDETALSTLFEDPTEFGDRLGDVGAAVAAFRPPLEGLRLLDGAPKQAILQAVDAVGTALDGAEAIVQLLESLLGEELVIRFDWNPRISSFWLPGANKASDDPIFRANDPKGFLVAVEARVKKSGGSAPKIGVVCGLKHFDLVLVAPASFLELNFEKIEFTVDSAAKMDVDVLLSDIKFVGPLSFVETLKDLIPLDGFSDPPYLDISPQGIDAGFSVALPGISIGVMSLQNLSLGAGFTVPFIGQPLSVRFNFCTREQPFTLTVYMFGGGGFFGITIDPSGVQIMEAAFEFGASISIDLGVASGGVSVMAGIYFRMEQDECTLTGYFRLAGHVDVLGLITASLELYLELRYETQSGKCVGRAELTIEISLFIFSGSVTVSCERKFAGSNGDPSLRDMLGFKPALPLEAELALIDLETDYAWREHAEAFA